MCVISGSGVSLSVLYMSVVCVYDVYLEYVVCTYVTCMLSELCVVSCMLCVVYRLCMCYVGL